MYHKPYFKQAINVFTFSVQGCISKISQSIDFSNFNSRPIAIHLWKVIVSQALRPLFFISNDQ